jgi:hypothetical protein
MSVPNTQTGKAVEKIREDGESLGNPAIVREFGSTATDNSAVVDHLSLSTDDKKWLGVRDDEVLVYPAKESAPGWAGRRRFQEINRKYEGTARKLVYIDGPQKGQDPCAHMQNDMVAVSREVWKHREAERQARGEAHIKKFRPTSREGEYELEEDAFDKTIENYRRRKRANSEMFRQMGIGEGSATSRMTLEEGLAYYARRGVNIEHLENAARQRGGHPQNNRENWHAILRGESGGKQFTSGFGAKVNPNSALGQVQQRNARQQQGK